MNYSETIIKKNGILIKYIPIPEGDEPVRALLLPDDVDTIGSACFAPEGTDIPENIAFDWDVNFPVELIMIPENIKKICPAAFMGLMTLKSIMVMGSDACFVQDGILYSGDGKKALCCPPCKEGEVTLIDGVTTIEENAFEGSYLTSVTIPDTVKEIKDDNFSWSYDLESVYVPASVKKIGERCFSDCDNLTVYGEPGTPIHAYCVKNGISFRRNDK